MKHFLIINVGLVSLYVRYTLVAAVDLRTETKIIYSKLLTMSDFIFVVMHVTLLTTTSRGFVYLVSPYSQTASKYQHLGDSVTRIYTAFSRQSTFLHTASFP